MIRGWCNLKGLLAFIRYIECITFVTGLPHCTFDVQHCHTWSLFDVYRNYKIRMVQRRLVDHLEIKGTCIPISSNFSHELWGIQDSVTVESTDISSIIWTFKRRLLSNSWSPGSGIYHVDKLITRDSRASNRNDEPLIERGSSRNFYLERWQILN